MPEPQENEPRDEFIERCIPIVIREGTATNITQAYVVCLYMYEKNGSNKKKNL